MSELGSNACLRRALHYNPVPAVEIDIWLWVFALFFFPMFVFPELWADWFRNQSKNIVVFPEFKDSSNSRKSLTALDRDPDGIIPPYAGIVFNGTNAVFALRDKKIAVVPLRSIEHAGPRGNWRFVYAPVIPIQAEALVGFFGGTVGVSKLVSYVRSDSEGWFSLLNSLDGEDVPTNFQTMDEFKMRCENIQRSRGLIESGERDLIQSLRELHMEMSQGRFGKIGEKFKKFWKKG